VAAGAMRAPGYEPGGRDPWEEDFTYNGLDWSKRGELLDESIEILRGLMTGNLFAYEGKHNKFGPIKFNPVPTAPVPVVIGGHSKPALRRAAKMGDGWTVVNMDFDPMKAMIAELRELRRAYGTDDRNLQIHARQYNVRTASQERPDLGSWRARCLIGTLRP
jgi:alkanesulfonate monooxygenase SsuD/methylene tetrahydromethanopterin reductase-like flavin-dependent oxidoreductase (luciferase family)